MLESYFFVETLKINTKTRKNVEVTWSKVSKDEHKNRHQEKTAERGVRKENLRNAAREDVEVGNVDLVHENEGESIHETESDRERLTCKPSEDDYEGTSRTDLDKESSDVSSENFKTEDNFKHSFSNADYTLDEPKDSDIESDKTDERNGK